MELIQGQGLVAHSDIFLEYRCAILAMAEAARGASDMTLLILDAHLEALCAAQLQALKGHHDEEIQASQG